MAISSNPPYATESGISVNDLHCSTMAHVESPKTSLDTSGSEATKVDSVDNTAEFEGDVKTDDRLPSQKTLKEIEDFSILDEEGKTIPFRNIYSGPNVARRVLVIFIRHFFCGNCQEYIRSLTTSISTSSLLSLPTPTFIAIIGCGSPSLIPMYRATTSCPFPIYADPTKKLYNALGMLRTLNLGTRPEYQRRELLHIMANSFVQSLKMMKGGMALKGGDYHQVGGEFLFEPVDGSVGSSPDEEKPEGWEVEKRVTWCHRMRNTRDHAEIPELREVLRLDGEGVPGGNKGRWKMALLKRKGTGLSAMSVGSGFSERKNIEG